ncbi:hypothetical protein KR009_008353, partial [Drosophila setifemur]
QAKPQNLLQLDEQQRSRFLDSFDRVISDIDGVVWSMESMVPNAAEGYKALERIGKPVQFVTNNSVRSVGQIVRRFDKLGMTVQPEQISHPAQAIVDYLRGIKFEGLIYIIASSPFKKVLSDAGLQLIDGPHDPIEESVEGLFKGIFDPQPVKAVVIDVDFNLNCAKMLRAQQYLRKPGCLLIQGATDRLLPMGRGLNIIGPGPFSSILVEASGKEAITLGKPGRELGDLLIRQYKIDQPSRVLMIGDMLAQDVAFGRQSGFQTLLVLSGGCTLEQLQAETDPSRIPDYYADSVADVAALLGHLPKAHV